MACHTPPVYTNQQAFNVGTGGQVDTPSLVGLALSAPYFHDGSATTLRERLQHARCPSTHRQDDHLRFGCFAGVVVGVAIMHRVV
ncbi:MAG UNVERIFIED_CONTAM: hypothetical protein LVT10_16580 [Anaerolineae bacterium]